MHTTDFFIVSGTDLEYTKKILLFVILNYAILEYLKKYVQKLKTK